MRDFVVSNYIKNNFLYLTEWEGERQLMHEIPFDFNLQQKV